MKKTKILMLAMVLAVTAVGCGEKRVVDTKDVPERMEITEETETVAISQPESTESDAKPDAGQLEEMETENAVLETESADAFTEDVNNSESDWTSFTFTVNGNTISLPCTYQEITEKLNVSMSSSQEKSYLDSGYYTLITLKDANGKSRFNAELTNFSEEEQVFADCMITRISQTAHFVNDEDTSYIATFPGGITAGQNADIEVMLSVLGEPMDVHEYADGDYWSNTYTWCMDKTWKNTNKYEIVVVNGRIDTVTLDNR